MKKIEDYLHLYLGCEVGQENSGGVIQRRIVIGLRPKYDEQKKCEVKQLLLQDTTSPDDPLFEPTAAFWEWPHKVKLILRPLSDMTEDEAEEIDNEFGGLGNFLSSALKNNETRYVKRLDDSFEITRRLLSKHFDLFNLIPEGLAINPTS